MLIAPALHRWMTGGVTWVQASALSLQKSSEHESPSLHRFGAWVQAPVAGVQPSVVQKRLSSQLTGVPGPQLPAVQISAPLHRSPS